MCSQPSHTIVKPALSIDSIVDFWKPAIFLPRSPDTLEPSSGEFQALLSNCLPNPSLPSQASLSSTAPQESQASPPPYPPSTILPGSQALLSLAGALSAAEPWSLVGANPSLWRALVARRRTLRRRAVVARRRSFVGTSPPTGDPLSIAASWYSSPAGNPMIVGVRSFVDRLRALLPPAILWSSAHSLSAQRASILSIVSSCPAVFSHRNTLPHRARVFPRHLPSLASQLGDGFFSASQRPDFHQRQSSPDRWHTSRLHGELQPIYRSRP
jgi:hypothetical protein